MKRIGLGAAVVAAGLISFLVAAALLFGGLPAMLWVIMDTLHDNGIAHEWMALLGIAILIGHFGIVAMFCWMSAKKVGRVSALPLAG